jgi:uncharacterized membrane protein YkvA (DUF1232 family)
MASKKKSTQRKKREHETLGRLGAKLGAHKAAVYLKNPDKAKKLFEQALGKGKGEQGPLGEAWESMRDLVRLGKAYVRKEYTKIPWQSLLLVGGAIVYFVTPVDFVPDFLLGLGFTDDIAVLAWVMKTIQKDVEAFRAWEAQQGS